MIVDVLLRVVLEPAWDAGADLADNEMLSDLRSYIRRKEADKTLQSNGTRMKIDSFITNVVTLDR